MAQISIIEKSNFNSEKRIDAEYFKLDVLKKIALLEKHISSSLDKIANFVIGPFGSTVTIDKYVNDSEYHYVRNKDINDFIINNDEPALIPKTIYDELPQFHIKEKDLLITVVGTLGKVAIAQEKDTNSIFSCKSTIIRTKKISPFFLLTYLNSRIGQLFILRAQRGAIQAGLNLIDLKEIKVFIASDNFQELIERIALYSFNLFNSASRNMTNADKLLLSEIGLINWRPTHEKIFVRNNSEVQTALRIDAEHYQPKYDEIIRKISPNVELIPLKTVSTYKKGIEVGGTEYKENGKPFWRVCNITKFGLDEQNLNYIEQSLYDNLKENYEPKQGELLLSKDATPGIALYMNEQIQGINSSGILRLQLINGIPPYYLELVLNSIFVQMQIEKQAGGSIIIHWKPKEVMGTIIPRLGNTKEKEINDLVEQSHQQRKLSKQLIEIAKKGVEKAIEENETIAERWISEETEKLGITLKNN